MMLLVLPSCHQVKVNGKDVSVGVQEIIEMSQGDGGHLVVDVLWKNATGRHHRSVDVATQTDPPAGCTGVMHPALPVPPLPDRHYFLHGSTADLDYNHYPRVECECNLQAEDESVAKTNPLREAPNVQDQDSGLGYMDGGGQNEEEWGDGEGGERCCELGSSGNVRARDGTSFRNPVTSDDDDDEWSDPGMHGVSHGEYQQFQRVLEEKWRLYSRASKPKLGREASPGEETGNKWEKRVEEWKSGGLRKCKSGEVSGPGQDTGHWSLERTLVVEQQKDLQTCPTSNERHCRISSKKSCHQNPSPSIVEPSVPDPALGVTTSCDVARERAGNEQRSGQDSWPDSRQRQESDSGQGWPHIPRHARHYWSYMQLVQKRAAVECSAGEHAIGPGRRSGATESSLAATKQTRERLVRLRQRAARIGEQHGGLSTEDDEGALSEVKLGRHWSRVDRHRQWAQARDRRQGKEVRSRLEEVVRERAQSAGGGGTRAAGIIELSQGLASRRRNKKVFDNWVTIQELLAHGSRAADGTMVCSPLLSVTTV